MKVKFTIPTELNGLTVSQFQDFQKILDANEGAENSTFVQMKMLEIFCAADPEKLRGLDINLFSSASDELAKVLKQKPTHQRIINVNGQEFGFIPKLDDITLGEYVDLESYMQSPKDYHRAMAVMYRPITIKARDTYDIEPYQTSEKYSEVMRSAGLSDTLGAMLFFWNLGRELVEYTLHSLKKESKTTSTEKGRNLQSDTDGINQSYILQMETLLKLMKSQEQAYISAFLN